MDEQYLMRNKGGSVEKRELFVPPNVYVGPDLGNEDFELKASASRIH
jgi:hypothetical protein